ncbi:phytanoyl-CoA dioxygenase family protein [Flammeovirga yaeyamensis]|uniref:Phytanoyl-CoA dioxygenase family protein n=1 Tax=Flammeovirga yaeyamensis TaxID=367791 RepID=A0AAX1N654_9BACT|nr:phytanoyl-CoA dioxygenase family protein [Flammeovirga yaeyamensis]MBB3700719.1 ectoine hydroxylase-related dioxygenase (phytanoyl-CoA dioxygenase family) [Flammeovirga yaeyamensis]NMF37924.1 phytanoyl-CoA dioxygenase family protein [Flammeovirga yaeyamensis]QWG01715.1 phytanoyl-CoA dioxygenase family protein [Flammeovirga yaeyamensis]
MEIKQLAEQFWANGYVVIEDYFSEEMMDSLNDKIIRHFGMNPDFEHNDEFLDKSATEVVPWFPERENEFAFRPINDDPLMQNLTKEILGEEWNELYCMIMFSKKGTKGQAWHQDCPPENKSQFNLNRLVYTHDITDEIGGQTLVVPGTHKHGEISAGIPDEALENQIVLTPKKGTVVLLHGHCWHRVLPIKGTYRVSTNFRAMPKDTPEDITDIAVYRNMRYKFSTSEVVEERV